jgi:hypothetical protein
MCICDFPDTCGGLGAVFCNGCGGDICVCTCGGERACDCEMCGQDFGGYDDDSGPPEFGCCLPPGECCMPGLHFPNECHTAADYERAQFGGWASDASPSNTPNTGNERRP